MEAKGFTVTQLSRQMVGHLFSNGSDSVVTLDLTYNSRKEAGYNNCQKAFKYSEIGRCGHISARKT